MDKAIGPFTDGRRLTLIGLLAISAMIILINVWLEVQQGGSKWQQGDWLINALNGYVRRGLAGSLFVHIADWTSTSPVVVVALIQSAALSALLALTFSLFNPLILQSNYLLLLLSPGFYVLFWAADPAGSLRKELIAFCAMAMLSIFPVLGHHGPNLRRFWLTVSGLIFALSCLAHEGNIFLMPAFLTLLWMSGAWLSDRWFTLSPAFLAIFGTLAGLIYALMHSHGDVDAVCAPLLERGAPQSLCQGAIAWINVPLAEGINRTWAITAEPNFVWKFCVAGIAAALPLLYFIRQLINRKTLLLACFIACVPIMPLYLIAIDWGRWLDMQITSMVFIVCTMGLQAKLSFRQRLRPLALSFFIIIGLALSPDHYYALRSFGLLEQLLTLLMHFSG
ncbi:hypothetical protein [Rhizobium sp. SL86]|uniref:hypothetical protein n=1 Tax=Rhizobium sp. SL86 TaxID=2995148 RepID=UPI0022760578|nr:hypothetical protein [Rhizobium sp. SL86]MCY1663919.1 hypothetical protein [Rhizobium sp. SL86]